MSGYQPTPTQLLAAARSTARAGSGWGPAWARAAALLTRQALEDAIDTIWTGPATAMLAAPRTAQLTCLPVYLGDPDLAYRAGQAWHGLSNACHAHPYELAPSLDELNHWMAVTDTLISALASPPLPTTPTAAGAP